MRDNEQYAAAVDSCKTAARGHGHTLGVRYPIDEWLHAAMCVDCDKLVLVARQGGEENWRRGGMTLHEVCFR
jgi:hypothetical protein